jgi:nucleoside-diphosphate-sugar epimerase
VLDQARGEIKDQYLDASLAARELGWTATVALDEGLRSTYQWYRSLLGAN